MICSVLLLSLATVGFAQNGSESAAGRLTNGELASLVLQAGQPAAAALQPDVAMQQAQRAGLMPAHWRSGSVVTQGSFAEVMDRIGVRYTVNQDGAPMSDADAKSFLRREDDRVSAAVSPHADRPVPPTSVLSDRRPRVVSSADFE
jgi:hypothetical protein